jgi:hypothetical protein
LYNHTYLLAAVDEQVTPPREIFIGQELLLILEVAADGTLVPSRETVGRNVAKSATL